MKSKKTWLLYSIYIIAITAFFIFYLFPSDKLKNYITYKLNSHHPDINVKIDKVKLSFPLSLRIDNVTLYHLNDSWLDAEQIKIVPDLLSLFSAQKIFFFKGKTYEGSLEGRGKFTRNTPTGNVVIDAKLSRIQIKQVDAIQNLTGLKISGVLDGNFTYSEVEKSEGHIKADLIISDCTIEPLTPLLNLDRITFKKIEADFSIKNQKLQFKRCTFKGNQMDGNIAGSVTLNRPIGKSVLKLTGTIKPHQVFLAKLGKDFPASQLSKKIFNKNGFPIKFYGTLDKPSFSFY